MKKPATVAGEVDRDDSVYRAFHKLAAERRREVALRILRDERMLQDLYDHFLIQESLREKGRSISWEAYLRRRSSAAR